MKTEIIRKHRQQERRRMRVRSHMHGTALKPRLSVMKSNKHIHVQLIDDDKGVTLGSVSTISKEFRSTPNGKKNKESARKLGETIGGFAAKGNIKEIIFDRGPYKYHGILAELADGVRAGWAKVLRTVIRWLSKVTLKKKRRMKAILMRRYSI